MKKLKIMSFVFSAFAILLSNVMCAVVAYNYCRMIYGIKYEGFSAPANIAFYSTIPYLKGIIVCAVLATVFYKRAKEYPMSKSHGSFGSSN